MDRETLQEYYELKSSMNGSDAKAGPLLRIEELNESRILARAVLGSGHVRSGGMVFGPVIFEIADAMGYLVTISRSPKGADAFTVDVSLQFLRHAPPGELSIEGVSLHCSKRRSVVDVAIHSASVPEGPVAHAVVTYAPVEPRVLTDEASA